MKFIIEAYKREMQKMSPVEKVIYIILNIVFLSWVAYYIIPPLFK